MQKTPIDHTYLQSYLIKAGIRFDYNVIDTVCARKFSATFYMVLITALLILSVPQGMPGNPIPVAEDGSLAYAGISSSTKTMYFITVGILGVYLGYYLLRLCYYIALRTALRSDPAPLSVEAYAVVCLDVKTRPIDYIYQLFSIICGRGKNGFCRYAVIYKEIGSENPRFFLTAAVSHKRLCFIPDHIGRVFLHRKKPHLYTLDDKSSYQTVSAKRRMMRKFAMPASTMACSSQPGKSQDLAANSDTAVSSSNLNLDSNSSTSTVKAEPQQTQQ